MPIDPALLPRDPDRLIEIIVALQDRNAHLEGVVAALKRTVYGPRSEKLIADTAQLPLDLDDVVFNEPAAAANDDTVGPQPAKPGSSRPAAARNIGALPKHLPRYEVMIEPESTICPCCGGTMHVIGEDVSEQLDVIPAVLRVKRMRRPRYGCRSCESAVVQAKAPPRLVENGMATTALVTSIVVGKVCLAPAAEPPDGHVAGSGHSARSLDPGALGDPGGMVAEAAPHTARWYRARLTEGFL